MSVKRYKYVENKYEDGWDLLMEDPQGEWMHASDYDAAMARITALETALRLFVQVIEDPNANVAMAYSAARAVLRDKPA